MKKMLMLASVASMIDQFNMTNIEILREMGYEVHVAANFDYGSTSSNQRVDEFKKELDGLAIPYHNVCFSREISNIKTNFKAYKQVKNLMLKNKYEFVHCHSPIGGVCGRLAASRTKTVAIYTAHGFHFYKGASLKKWLFYYPAERILAHFTDVLITINKEDYNIAKNKFRAKRIEYIPGIGVDTKKFGSVKIDRFIKRSELNIPENTIVLLSVGELISRKNHETAIKAFAMIDNPNIMYLICGYGGLMESLNNLTKNLGIEDKVRFLGFRKDIAEICSAVDIFVFPSFQEGLPVALMEAMSATLPIVCSKIRGNNDLISENLGGYLCNPNDIQSFASKLDLLIVDKKLRSDLGDYNQRNILNYDIEVVNKRMKSIYNSI